MPPPTLTAQLPSKGSRLSAGASVLGCRYQESLCPKGPGAHMLRGTLLRSWLSIKQRCAGGLRTCPGGSCCVSSASTSPLTFNMAATPRWLLSAPVASSWSAVGSRTLVMSSGGVTVSRRRAAPVAGSPSSGCRYSLQGRHTGSVRRESASSSTPPSGSAWLAEG